MKLLDFKPGNRVVYQRRVAINNRENNNGREATVVRPVKSRKMVTIKWVDTGKWYDAHPDNLDVLT